MDRFVRRGLGVVVAVAAVATSDGAARAEAPAMALVSPAFKAGDAIPARFTCDGRDVSPPLQWSGVPAKAESLVLVLDDPDAPVGAGKAKTPFVHWILYDLPPSLLMLPDAVDAAGLPTGARAGRNDFGKAAWGGPCPPRPGKHRYVFRLYALDTLLYDLKEPTRAQLGAAMKGHVLAKVELTATYQRQPE